MKKTKLEKKVDKIMLFIKRDLSRVSKESYERECKKHLVGEMR